MKSLKEAASDTHLTVKLVENGWVVNANFKGPYESVIFVYTNPATLADDINKWANEQIAPKLSKDSTCR